MATNISRKELLAAIIKGTAGMIPVVGALTQEFVGLCLPRSQSDLKNIDSISESSLPAWLVFVQSHDGNYKPVFWQIAAVASNEYEGRRLAEKLIHAEGCFPTKVDASFQMQEDKALAHESFGKLYLAARAYGVAAIRMEGEELPAA